MSFMVCGCFADLNIVFPTEFTQTYRAASVFLKGFSNNYIEVIGDLAINSSTNQRGKLVLAYPTVPLEPLYRQVQNLGATAILLQQLTAIAKVPGRTMFLPDGSDTSNITIPISEL